MVEVHHCYLNVKALFDSFFIKITSKQPRIEGTLRKSSFGFILKIFTDQFLIQNRHVLRS